MSLPAAGQIRWGSTFKNVVSFAWPTVLDNQLVWRRPAMGSQFLENPAGVSDAWITGRDFILEAQARWFDPSRWTALQEFLDWAQEGNAFRLVPDDRYPKWYIDSCYLVEPKEPRPGLERGGAEQGIDLVIRNRTFDFSLMRRGLLWEYVPGRSLTDPYVATFTRASTAPYIDEDGATQSAASGVLRDEHYDGSTRTTRLQAAWASQTQPDFLRFPIRFPTKVPLTFYLKYVERGLKDTASAIPMYISSVSPEIFFYRHATLAQLFIKHNNGATFVESSVALSHALGDVVEVRGIYRADGSVAIGLSINGGAESVSSFSAANTPAAAWTSERITIGAADNGGNQASDLPLIRLAIGLGEQTLTSMRTA